MGALEGRLDVDEGRLRRVLYAIGVLLVLSGIVHAAVFLADGGSWWGPVSWRKPIVFGFSFGISLLTFGWVQGLLPHNRLLGWLTTVLIGLAGAVEVGLITLQRWRRVPSHFNVFTAFDERVFTWMGITIAFVGVGLVVLFGWAALRLRRPASAVIAVLSGLGLVLVGSAIGQDLITRGLAVVERTGAVPSSVVMSTAGSGKLAHAAALHGLQVLGALELLLRHARHPLTTRIMGVAAVGYVASTALIIGQAYSGRSMLEVPMATAIGLVVGLSMVGGAFATALRALATYPEGAGSIVGTLSNKPAGQNAAV